jgi:hypothetical protein
MGYAALFLLLVVLILVGDEIEDVLGHFLHGLDEFRLVRIAPFDALHEGGEIDVIARGHGRSPGLRPGRAV